MHQCFSVGISSPSSINLSMHYAYQGSYWWLPCLAQTLILILTVITRLAELCWLTGGPALTTVRLTRPRRLTDLTHFTIHSSLIILTHCSGLWLCLTRCMDLEKRQLSIPARAEYHTNGTVLVAFCQVVILKHFT